MNWLPENISTFGGEIDRLFYFIYYLTGITFLLVAGGRGQTPMALAMYSDGIAGDRFVRESTAALLRTLEDRETAHPTEPHGHAEARVLASPMPTTPESVVAGAATYARHCAACHGVTGRGDGQLAAATAAYGARPSNVPPLDSAF